MCPKVIRNYVAELEPMCDKISIKERKGDLIELLVRIRPLKLIMAVMDLVFFITLASIYSRIHNICWYVVA